MTGGTLAEFMNDAVKYYIDHLEEKRYDEMRYQEYVEKRKKKSD